MNFIKFSSIFAAMLLCILMQTVYGQRIRFYNSGSYRDRDYRVRYGYGSERYYLSYPNTRYYTHYPTYYPTYYPAHYPTHYQNYYESGPTRSIAAVRKPTQTATKSSATATSSVPLTDRSDAVAAAIPVRRRRPAVVDNANYIDY